MAERASDQGLIVTRRHGFAYFDPESGELAPVAQVEAHLPGNRFNDGKCDHLGRFWAGTMDFDGKKCTGSLYRLLPDRNFEQIDSGYAVTNGPAWSVDHTVLYHNDSANGRVYAFDHDPQTGAVSNKRLFLQFSPEEGSPDGMTTDAEGGLWIAHWGAGKLTRRDPDGEVTATVTLPCSQVSSCTFGGPDLKTLFITTAAVGLSPSQLEREPLAGSLFAVEPGFTGLPAHTFRG